MSGTSRDFWVYGRFSFSILFFFFLAIICGDAAVSRSNKDWEWRVGVLMWLVGEDGRLCGFAEAHADVTVVCGEDASSTASQRPILV